MGLSRLTRFSLDAHKWLYAPVDCGCLLFRDEAGARSAFASNEADYIKVYEEAEAESFAFWDYGVELSRRFRALKIWMMLRYYGTRRVASAISEDNSLAAYMAERITAAEDFELLAPVELSICCFRYVPPALRASAGRRAAARSEELKRAESIERAHHARSTARRARYLQTRRCTEICPARLHTNSARRERYRPTLDIVREAASETNHREIGREGGSDKGERKEVNAPLFYPLPIPPPVFILCIVFHRV